MQTKRQRGFGTRPNKEALFPSCCLMSLSPGRLKLRHTMHVIGRGLPWLDFYWIGAGTVSLAAACLPSLSGQQAVTRGAYFSLKPFTLQLWEHMLFTGGLCSTLGLKCFYITRSNPAVSARQFISGPAQLLHRCAVATSQCTNSPESLHLLYSAQMALGSTPESLY